jgi:hypothetical protein
VRVLGNAVLTAHVIDHVDDQDAEPSSQQGAYQPNPQLPIDQQQIANRGELGIPNSTFPQNALISSGRTMPVCNAIHQYNGTAMIVSRIAATDGTSF